MNSPIQTPRSRRRRQNLRRHHNRSQLVERAYDGYPYVFSEYVEEEIINNTINTTNTTTHHDYSESISPSESEEADNSGSENEADIEENEADIEENEADIEENEADIEENEVEEEQNGRTNANIFFLDYHLLMWGENMI